MHPGNYVFFDRQQLAMGCCTEEEVFACLNLLTKRLPQLFWLELLRTTLMLVII
jgi:D-serine deaminase-like pyridoxal phosphate-dependent protein